MLESAAFNMPANLEYLVVATRLKEDSFHSNPKERQCQKLLKIPHNCTNLTRYQSNAQILQVRLQQQMNRELPNVQAGFRKGRGTRYQIANIHWIIEKAREFQKNIYFCFIDYSNPFIMQIIANYGKILEVGILDHLTCLLSNLYAGQEATIRTGHGTADYRLVQN